jgi:hypothetical protein
MKEKKDKDNAKQTEVNQIEATSCKQRNYETTLCHY